MLISVMLIKKKRCMSLAFFWESGCLLNLGPRPFILPLKMILVKF